MDTGVGWGNFWMEKENLDTGVGWFFYGKGKFRRRCRIGEFFNRKGHFDIGVGWRIFWERTILTQEEDVVILANSSVGTNGSTLPCLTLCIFASLYLSVSSFFFSTLSKVSSIQLPQVNCSQTHYYYGSHPSKY